MGEIEVNEYIRTNTGYIAKLEQYLSNTGTYLFDDFIQEIQGDKYRCISENELEKVMVKHSKQLIDLIENKDVLKVRIDKMIMVFGMDEDTSDIKYKELIENIENREYELLEILTREQFEQSSYKLGGEE